MERELEDSRAGRSANLARFSEELRAKEEELQAKEEERTTKEDGAYVNTHNDLLAELRKRYPEEDFSWMNQLILEAEEEIDEEPEREKERIRERMMYLGSRLGVIHLLNDLYIFYF